MLNNDLSFQSILLSLESALKLEVVPECTVNENIESAVSRLENTYGVTLDDDIFKLRDASELMASNLQFFFRDITTALAQLSLYINLKLYHKDTPIRLSDVNYIGYAKTQLLTALRYLMDEEQNYKYSDDLIEAMSNTLNNIQACNTKRLFVIMIMLQKLGVREGAAIAAQLLYIGGLVK